jgi:hypothetical protein
MSKKSKLGPAYKYGEPSVAITVRIPKSVYDGIPEPKRDSIVIEVVKKFKKKLKNSLHLTGGGHAKISDKNS